MRIIGGKYKRRRFDVPKSFNARPTTDFAKENLFNVLQYYIDFEDATALDLFSGTGSISAELISRGCSRVIALEQRREHALFIRSIARELKEEGRLQVLQSDVFRYLQTSKGGRPQFDFIFADPPYKLKEIATLPQMILARGSSRATASSSWSTQARMTSPSSRTSQSIANTDRSTSPSSPSPKTRSKVRPKNSPAYAQRGKERPAKPSS